MTGERQLLQAVLEALTLPYSAADYDRRLSERASWARTVLDAVVTDPAEDIAWNAAYLRRKMRAEEAGK